MTTFYVRTGTNGADPAVPIDDLGYTVPTGAGWTVLSAGDDGNPNLDGYGQFTARELRDSEDLYDLITGSSLEYSLDGATEETKPFVSDIPIMGDFTDDHLNLTDGRLTLPNDVNPPGTIGDPQPGDLFYDTDDGYLVFYSGVSASWVSVTDTGVATDHGILNGLLDDDHSQYGLLDGYAARNPVTGTYDFTDGYLTAPVNTVAPTDNLVDGSVVFITGVMYSYDATRTAWLSVDRKFLSGGKNGNANNVYLRLEDGIASSQTGYRALRDGTITGLFAQTDEVSTWDFQVRLNGATSPSVTLSVTAATGDQATAANVNFSQGDEIQFYADTPGGPVKAPVAGIEIAWRV